MRIMLLFAFLLTAFLDTIVSGPAYAGLPLTCESVFDSHKQVFWIDSRTHNHSGDARNLVSRAYFATQMSYLDRGVLNREKTWDVLFAPNSAQTESSNVDVLVVTSREMVPARQVIDQFDIERGPYSPKGHPLAKLIFEVVKGVIANNPTDLVYRDILGHVRIAFDYPKARAALVSRLVVDKAMGAEQRLWFYREVAARLKARGAQEVFIEVVDEFHRRLYEAKFGFVVSEVLSGDRYGVERMYLMHSSVAALCTRLGVP